ncbi:hypothetical protein FPV67DRAFT_1503422 [Lyophyllum atratum]|nr:hypothetical protein FPV67DRAFT_1503422 [Lyophyllum atratum]
MSLSSNNEQELPAKKRRRVMGRPDGFEIHKPSVNVPKTNIQVPRFTSAFGMNVQSVQQKPLSKPKLDARSPFIHKEALKPSLNKPTSKTNLRQLPVPSFPLAPKEKDKDKDFAPAHRIRPPPDPRCAAKTETTSITVPHLQLRPPPLPPPPPNAPLLRPGVPLKNLPAPTIFASADTALEKDMRTISTTEIALATDLFTDSGAAELAHIFLRDQHPEITASTKEEPSEWNLGMSPQKGTKFVKGTGKEAKFVKGGLAARASELMACSHTSLALWHKETERQLATSSHRMTPDLRLRIVEIIDSPAAAKPSSPRKRTFSVSTTVSPGVALCRVISTRLSKHPRPTHVTPDIREKQHHLVVLSFPTTAPPRLKGQKEIYVRNPEDFIPGREVCVWEPWLEVSRLPQSPSLDDFSSNNMDPELMGLIAAPFPTLPSTYPRSSPPPGSMGHGDIRISDTVLLCSRFVIMP